MIQIIQYRIFLTYVFLKIDKDISTRARDKLKKITEITEKEYPGFDDGELTTHHHLSGQNPLKICDF